MENHKWRDGIDDDGLEGSNVIYLGKDGGGNQLFLHMDGGKVEKFEGLRNTVRGYSPAAQWDPIYKYKFTERYVPNADSTLACKIACISFSSMRNRAVENDHVMIELQT